MTIISRPFSSAWKLSWGVVDQVVISAANFAMMLVLARALGPTDFGVFGLVFPTIMLTVTVQGAMICQPHNVRGAVLRGRQYVDFTASTAAYQIVFMCGTAMILLLGFGVAHHIGWEYDSLLLALVPTTLFFEWQEFNRRVFYTEDRLRDAAMNDAMSYLSQTLSLTVLWVGQRLNSIETALIPMAATSRVADELVEKLTARFPGLTVAGQITPPMLGIGELDDPKTIGAINAANPDIVWVGLGAPKQDWWVANHRKQLNAPVLIAVGAAFDFHSGRVKQAPKWMQRNGLEWLFRFSQDPKRLWHRYRLHNTSFVLRVAGRGHWIRKSSGA